MEQWKETSLIELIELIGGGTPKTSIAEYWNGDISWVSVKDFNNENRYVYETEKHITQLGLSNSSTKMLQKDDIIISARGTVGEMAMIPYPMAFNQSCYGIRGKQDVNQVFLYYLIKSSVRKLKSITHGSVFDTITRDTFANITVKVPSESIQEKIAGLLSTLDDKIEQNIMINKNLEEQAVILFKDKFLRVDDDIDTKESPFGLIDGKYSVIKNGELDMLVTDYVANGSFASLKENVTLYQERNYAHFIRNTDLKAGTFPVYVDQHSYEFLSKSVLYGGEIIISNVGDVGSVFLCPTLDGPMTLGNNIIMIRPENESMRLFLYIWFKHLLGQGLIKGITGGSAQPKFNKTDFKNLPLLVPDESSLDKFDEVVKPIFDLISSNDIENKRLVTLRDALLPQLMSGKLDVSDIDI